MINKLGILGVQCKACRLAVISAVVGAAVALSACGQKGPLYLPEKAAQQTTESAGAKGTASSTAKQTQ